jgi:hypothetical protein
MGAAPGEIILLICKKGQETYNSYSLLRDGATEVLGVLPPADDSSDCIYIVTDAPIGAIFKVRPRIKNASCDLMMEPEDCNIAMMGSHRRTYRILKAVVHDKATVFLMEYIDEEGVQRHLFLFVNEMDGHTKAVDYATIVPHEFGITPADCHICDFNTAVLYTGDRFEICWYVLLNSYFSNAHRSTLIFLMLTALLLFF